jgi:hypothetical protein
MAPSVAPVPSSAWPCGASDAVIRPARVGTWSGVASSTLILPSPPPLSSPSSTWVVWLGGVPGGITPRLMPSWCMAAVVSAPNIGVLPAIMACRDFSRSSAISSM